MANLLGEDEITPAKFMDLNRTPFFMKVPGLKGGVDETYGGQTDVMPTLLDVLGIKSNNYIMFGTDLLAKGHDQTVAFRNGDFITPEYKSIGSTVYDNKTNKPMKTKPKDLEENKNNVEKNSNYQTSYYTETYSDSMITLTSRKLSHQTMNTNPVTVIKKNNYE